MLFGGERPLAGASTEPTGTEFTQAKETSTGPTSKPTFERE